MYGDIQHNSDNRQNVVSYWNGERDEKNFLFLYRDMQGNTDNRQNLGYIFKLRKSFCLAANQRAQACVEGRKCRC